MAVIEIKNDCLSVGINTFGSELAFINGSAGTEFLWNGDKNVWSLRAPIMFPICGGLKDGAYTYRGQKYFLQKHGFAKEMQFRGRRISDTKAEFILESNEETKTAYPFDFRLTVVFELDGNALHVSNTVENLSAEEMYFSIGAHEGYACPEGIEEYEIVFDEKQTLDSHVLSGELLENYSKRIIEDSYTMPLRYEYFEVDALVFKDIKFDRATLAHKNGSKKVTVEFKDAQYFLLWTKPGAKYICLEPWNGIQDIVDSDFDITKKTGIIKLDGHKQHETVHTMRFFEQFD